MVFETCGGGLVAKVVSNCFATPWTVACQVPLSMGFPRQKYWSGLLFPPPGDLPDPGIEPMSPHLCFLPSFYNLGAEILVGSVLPQVPSGVQLLNR